MMGWMAPLRHQCAKLVFSENHQEREPSMSEITTRRPPLVVAVALANKTARIAWAVMLRQREYQPRAMAA